MRDRSEATMPCRRGYVTGLFKSRSSSVFSVVSALPGHGQDTARTRPGHGQDTARTRPGHGQDTARIGEEDEEEADAAKEVEEAEEETKEKEENEEAEERRINKKRKGSVTTAPRSLLAVTTE